MMGEVSFEMQSHTCLWCDNLIIFKATKLILWMQYLKTFAKESVACDANGLRSLA